MELDASLIATVDGVTLNDIVREERLSGIARNVEETAVDDNPVIVYKRGITEPKLTSGLLEPIATLVQTRVLTRRTGHNRAQLSAVFFVYGDGEPFAKPGDSGAVVTDADDCVVGMLVGLRWTHGTTLDENTPGSLSRSSTSWRPLALNCSGRSVPARSSEHAGRLAGSGANMIPMPAKPAPSIPSTTKPDSGVITAMIKPEPGAILGGRGKPRR